jgi:hypothetical protein
MESLTDDVMITQTDLSGLSTCVLRSSLLLAGCLLCDSEEYRCCEPEDEVARAACLSETGPDAEYHKDSYSKGPGQEGDMLDAVLSSSPAMTCVSKVLGSCPRFVSISGRCLKIQTNW